MTVAAVMTYDSLVENIQSYLERTDTATLDKIPTFIMLAEKILASEIKFLGNLNVVTTPMVSGQFIYAKPVRWRKTVSMDISLQTSTTNRRYPLFLRKYEYVRNYVANQQSSANEGLPKYYADYDYYNWFIAPAANTTALGGLPTLEVLYYEEVQPLETANQTNWFTTNAPQAMLYGTLLQAMPFLKNDERIPVWQQSYDRAIAILKNEDVTRVGDRQTAVIDS